MMTQPAFEHEGSGTASVLRVVGFKVDLSSQNSAGGPSPTSVLSSLCSNGSQMDSPRSSLAAALRAEAKPLPSLSIKTPRSLGALKKCKSHADLHTSGPSRLSGLGANGDPDTPGSGKSSAASTPMNIPAATISRVNTCPVDLSTLQATVATAAPVVRPPTSARAVVPPRHARRLSVTSMASADSDASVVRDLFDAQAHDTTTYTTSTAAAEPQANVDSLAEALQRQQIAAAAARMPPKPSAVQAMNVDPQQQQPPPTSMPHISDVLRPLRLRTPRQSSHSADGNRR